MARRAAGSDGDRTPSRRGFLQAAGIGVVGAAAAAAASVAGPGAPAPAAVPAGVPPRAAGPGFDHLVVLMFENRSFDNIFGWLYADEAPPGGGSFDGLTGAHANRTADGRVVRAHRYRGGTDQVMSSPSPDPGEEYPHVNTQLFGSVAPPENRGRPVHEMSAPYNAPADDRVPPTMAGFLEDYISTYRA